MLSALPASDTRIRGNLGWRSRGRCDSSQFVALIDPSGQYPGLRQASGFLEAVIARSPRILVSEATLLAVGADENVTLVFLLIGMNEDAHTEVFLISDDTLFIPP